MCIFDSSAAWFRYKNVFYFELYSFLLKLSWRPLRMLFKSDVTQKQTWRRTALLSFAFRISNVRVYAQTELTETTTVPHCTAYNIMLYRCGVKQSGSSLFVAPALQFPLRCRPVHRLSFPYICPLLSTSTGAYSTPAERRIFRKVQLAICLTLTCPKGRHLTNEAC